MYITKEILNRGIADWIQATRDGLTMPQEQADALSVEENANLATESLWDFLVADTNKFDK